MSFEVIMLIAGCLACLTGSKMLRDAMTDRDLNLEVVGAFIFSLVTMFIVIYRIS